MSRATTAGRPTTSAFPDAVEQLEAYFAGDRIEFDLELDLVGTEFQRRVWAALLTIPYGETRSYGEIAQTDRLAGRVSRGRPGQRPQSDRHHRAVPSGDRFQRQPHRLRRRTGPKTRTARIGEKPDSPIPTLFD